MKFYNEKEPLCLETYVSGVGLEAALLQAGDGLWFPGDKVPDNTEFASKSLTSTEKRYSYIECEALGILYGLEKFHHYCFAYEVSVITDHKPSVARFRMWQLCHKDYSRSSCTYTTTGYETYTSKAHNSTLLTGYPGTNTEGKDEEIKGMCLNINVIETCTDIQECMMPEGRRHPVQTGSHLNTLTECVINGWLSAIAKIKEIQLYWLF